MDSLPQEVTARTMPSGFKGRRRQRPWRPHHLLLPSVIFLLCLLPVTNAQQSCIRLTGSSTCPGFNTSSISTDQSLAGLFPFLSSVTDLRSFDSQLEQYVRSDYARSKYQTLFGCSSVDLSNTTDLYARYTYSFLCNAIVQNSLGPCGASMQTSPPLCAESCAEFANSEQRIVSSPGLCGNSGNDATSQLRADFTNCALPSQSLTQQCIHGYDNEPDDCGYQYNLQGLCTYCNSSTVNSTDSCCVNSQVESRCQNVRLPTFSSMTPLFPTSTSAMPRPTSSAAAASSSNRGLSGGQIAGIVVGAVVGAALLLGLLICCCLFMRRKRQVAASHSSLNQPTPPRSGIAEKKPSLLESLPGARVTRMAALEGSVGSSPPRGSNGNSNGASAVQSARSKRLGTSDDSPTGAGAVGMTSASKRDKSTSDGLDESSPESGGYSSGEGGVASQSEQMDSFKDYYSSDEIHANDQVSVLWAYQPRANDEFELERGDMLRVVGIWDDGWATGVRINQRAENWDPERKTQRDSGVSGGTGPDDSPPQNGEVKAFPLVCVCLPQHWRKTIEGDSTEPESSE